MVGLVHSNIGESLAASGDHHGALEAYAKALDILSRTLPPEHPDLAYPLKGRGQSRLALGDLPGALLDLERAAALYDNTDAADPVERADVEFSLAKVHRALGEEARARTWATAARQRLLDLEQTDRPAEITAWLDKTETRP
jgi:tetratricopeptide (TPR) repeat protein